MYWQQWGLISICLEDQLESMSTSLLIINKGRISWLKLKMPIDAHYNCSKLRIFVCKKIVSCLSAAASGQGQPLARDGPGAWWLAEALPLFPPYSFFFDQDGCSSSCQCHLLGVRRGCRAGHSPYGLHCPHQVGFSTTRIHVEHIRSYNELWARWRRHAKMSVLTFLFLLRLGLISSGRSIPT